MPTRTPGDDESFFMPSVNYEVTFNYRTCPVTIAPMRTAMSDLKNVYEAFRSEVFESK